MSTLDSQLRRRSSLVSLPAPAFERDVHHRLPKPGGRRRSGRRRPLLVQCDPARLGPDDNFVERGLCIAGRRCFVAPM